MPVDDGRGSGFDERTECDYRLRRVRASDCSYVTDKVFLLEEERRLFILSFQLVHRQSDSLNCPRQ